MLEEKQATNPNTKKSIITALTLLFFTFSWWPLTISIVKSYQAGLATGSSTDLLVWTSYYVSVVVSSMIGSVIGRRTGTTAFLQYWMALGVISTVVPMFLVSVSIWTVLAVSVLLGFAFGIGMPSCLAFFAGQARIEIRGSVSGAAFFGSNLAIATLALALQNTDLSILASVAAVWRWVGLALFVALRPEDQMKTNNAKDVPLVSLFQNRSFLFYFLPWLAFCLVDWFENTIRQNLFGLEFAQFADIIGIAVGSVSAIVGGIFADKIGRKIIVLYGFVSIGIAYAVLSIAPNTVPVWYFYTIINAIAWGILTSMFILTLWGDLSQYQTKERYYAVGNIPFFIAGIIGFAVKPYVTLIRPEAAFSLAAFFLFLAVLPLLYAPETLPERRIKERELKGYLEKAKKIKEKHV